MSFAEYLRELAYPARSLGIMVALVTFYLLFGLIVVANLLGIWLAVMVIPAFFRYLVMIAEARARGTDAQPPGIEFFSLAGNWWTLYPIIPIVATTRTWWALYTTFGPSAAGAFSLFAIAILPAMMAVLVITHSPLQSLNPLALYRVIRETGPTYWYASLTLILVFILPQLVSWLPTALLVAVGMYSVAAFYAVTGAVTRHRNLIDDVYIPEPLEPDVDMQAVVLLTDRTGILDHAYGFVSRGNREGGLSHVYDWLETDPDPDAAWAWFFEAMLKWELNRNALFFGQRYLSWLLAHDDPFRANKVILRCRMIDESFRPLPEDMPAAIEAAERGGNQELLASLKRL
jgi:hypothetical protein